MQEACAILVTAALLLSVVVIPSFATPYTSGSHNGYAGGGFGGGSAAGFAITSGQGHKVGLGDAIVGWAVGKLLDWFFTAKVPMDSCGGGACGGGSVGGF
jgi:hypothetical protein